MQDRLHQRVVVSLLRSHDGPPTILATQIFFLFDEPLSLAGIADNMTLQNVVVAVGCIPRSRHRLSEDVDTWAHSLFKQAGLSFNVANVEPAVSVPAALSVVPTQPATPKPEVQPKRKTRRVYPDLTIQYLEKGCTHKELVDSIMKQFPNLNRETIATFFFDVQNEKYSPIRDRKVVKQADGTLIFEDCVRPALTVIENPNHAGNEKADVEPVTDTGKAVSSKADV